MSKSRKENTYLTSIWNDIPSENPFIAEKSLCYGYDVFGDILKQGQFIDYLYLIMTGKRLTNSDRPVFEALLIALAHPGLRDPSVRAAMNAGVGGSRAASALMSALAVGAGQYTGAHEVRQSMDIHTKAKQNFEHWDTCCREILEPQDCDVWLQPEHVPGFNPHQITISKPSLQLLQHCAQLIITPSQTNWLLKTHKRLEAQVGYGVSFTGVVAAILTDLGFSPEIGEYIFLFSRLPGAAAHAVETRHQGFREFPFFNDMIDLENDPGPSDRINITNIRPTGN